MQRIQTSEEDEACIANQAFFKYDSVNDTLSFTIGSDLQKGAEVCRQVLRLVETTRN